MVLDPDCVFCRIIDGQAPASIVYRDELVTAFMDISPVTPGHLLVVPNQHSPYLEGLGDDAGQHLFHIGRRLSLAMRRSGLPCEGVNLYMADGAAAGQTVFHVHMHVIARYTGDGFRVHLPAGYGDLPSRQVLETNAGRVRDALLHLDEAGHGGTP